MSSARYPYPLEHNAAMALDAIHQRPTSGVPTWILNIMQHDQLERVAGCQPGDYERDPVNVYLRAQLNGGVCMIDQWIPENPLSMRTTGFDDIAKTATTGAETIWVDGRVIDSPEDVLAHIEEVRWPMTRQAIQDFDEDQRFHEILEYEKQCQELYGPSILKVPYGCATFPGVHYSAYGYSAYFMAYAEYPEVMAQDFALQAQYAVLHNRAAARAYREGNLPPLLRLDHDIADSRGTLVSVRSLEEIWLPHFQSSIAPLLESGIKLIWHCDGNLMKMVPILLECGLSGFQGFQYEDGMDYEEICRMTTRDGEPLFIIAGVSVTTTLPRGTPDDVRREINWLVEHGPATGLFLGGSSSIAPGVPWPNMEMLLAGLAYYRERRTPAWG